MRRRILCSLILAASMTHSVASAQLDSSSALMLNSTNDTATVRDNAFDKGRYTIRPKPEAKPEAKPTPRRSGSRTQGEDIVDVPASASVPAQPITVTIPSSTTPAPQAAPRETRVYVLPSATPVAAIAPSEATRTIPAESLRRYNILDLSFSPGFLYTNSDSGSFYRRYSTASPTLNVEANVWFTPSIGVHGSFLGTLSGHVNDSFSGSRNVPAAHQWFTAGLRSRKYFGDQTSNASLTFGIDYFEYEFRVPNDATLRSRLKSLGALISIEAEVPMSISHSWTVGAMLGPKLSHEEAITAANFSSGNNVDANLVGISLGSRVQFQRQDAIFWKVTHRIEKDLFSGDARQVDPLTGFIPSGVAVTNSFTLLELGYTWGN